LRREPQSGEDAGANHAPNDNRRSGRVSNRFWRCGMVHFQANGNFSKRRNQNKLTWIDKSQGNVRRKAYFDK
jgi:hypothetical protein